MVTQTTYRMMPVADLPDDVAAAFVAGRVEAVLHYSRRSARAFFQAVGLSGVEIAALAVPHCCLSAAVGTIAHDAGATQSRGGRPRTKMPCSRRWTVPSRHYRVKTAVTKSR